MIDACRTKRAQIPAVTVVVLSYNRPNYLSQALRSVTNQSYENLEILVVDNLSPSSLEIAEIVGQFSTVRFIANNQNLGFSRGMNQGVREASGKYVLLTEDDIVLDANCVREFVSYAESDPEAALLSGMVYNKAAGTIRYAGASLQLGGVYRMHVFGEGEYDHGQFTEPTKTDYMPGCMMFGRTRLLNSEGCFREDFFMYVEDCELCMRLKHRGGKLMFVPAAKAAHFEPGEPHRSDVIEFSKLRNLLVLYLLHARWRVLPEFLTRYFFSELLNSLRSDRCRAPLIVRAMLSVTHQLGELLRQRWQKALPINN